MLAAAAEAGIALGPRVPRVFDEVVDIVNFDLVLVLDHFDLTEVGTALLLCVTSVLRALLRGSWALAYLSLSCLSDTTAEST